MRYEFAIFDFDGTLADSFPWFLQVFDQVAERYRFKKLERGEIDEVRHFSTRRVLSHYGIPAWKLPFILRHMQLLMRRDIAAIQPVAGIQAALRALADQGMTLGILTSNSYENVTRVLGPETVALFSHWQCGSSIFGKTRKLRKLVRAAGVAHDRVIFVGDETRDADAAREARVGFGAVAWGFTRLRSLVTPADAATTFADPAELVTKLSLEQPGHAVTAAARDNGCFSQ